MLKLVLRFLSRGIRAKAKRRGVQFFVPFHVGAGRSAEQNHRVIEAGAIRPVVDRVFPFEATNDALAYVETGRAKGKVVIKLR